jgi:DnaJ-domain-containing protein 1
MSGQVVASLMATLGMDTTNFERGTKKVKAEFGSISPKLETVGKGVVGLVAQNATLIAGLTGVAVAAKASYMEFQNYAGSVRDLAAISGTGAVETSKLLQVLDDYQLTAQDVTAATRFMTKAGLTPTIDTLAKLSDQYKAINDPMQQNEFILKNLGKGGLQWVNVLQQGGAALRAQSEEVNKALVLTDAQIKKSEQARLAVDALSDSWQGVKVSVGSFVGGLIVQNDNLQKNSNAFRDLYGWMTPVTDGAGRMTDKFAAFSAQMEKGRAMTEFYSNSVKNSGSTLSENTTITDEQVKANMSLLDTIGALQSETQSFNEKNAALSEKYSELKIKQNEFAAGSKEYNELGKSIDGVTKDIKELGKEHDLAGKKIAFSLVQMKAASDGWQEGEFDALLNLGEQWGIYDASVVKAAQSMDAQASKVASTLAKTGAALSNAAAGLNNLAKMGDINLKINMNFSSNGLTPTMASLLKLYGNNPALGDMGIGGDTAVVNLTNDNYSTTTASAKGGKRKDGQWTLVGDKSGGVFVKGVSELISPDGSTVIDSKTSEAMIKYGMVGKPMSRAGGGSVSGSGKGLAPTSTPAWKSNIGKITPDAPAQAAQDNQQAIMNVTADLTSQIRGTTQTMSIGQQKAQMQFNQAMSRSTEQLTVVIKQMMETLKRDNPAAIGKQVAYELAAAQ